MSRKSSDGIATVLRRMMPTLTAHDWRGGCKPDRSKANLAERPPDVVIELPGVPRGKGAGRAAILPPNPAKGRFQARAMVFQDKETRSYEAMLRYAGERAMNGQPPFDEPLQCRLTAVFPVPASWSGKKRALALRGLIPHSVKPDDDNLIKTRDGLKNIVWTDDARICESLVRKLYGEKPFLRIEVWRWSPMLI